MAERPEDLNLPAAVVARLMKEALPEACSVSREARQAVCRAASVFVLYLTSQASAVAVQAKRKTLAAPDVISALKQIDMDEFVPPLQETLAEHQRRRKQKAPGSSEEPPSEPDSAEVASVH